MCRRNEEIRAYKALTILQKKDDEVNILKTRIRELEEQDRRPENSPRCGSPDIKTVSARSLCMA